MLAYQVRLRQPSGREMVVWVDAQRGIRAGSVVVGKDGRRWRVIAAYTQAVVETADLHTDWRVGGLT